jgi:hypothetical protein
MIYGYEIIHLNADGERESREFSSNPMPWQIDWKKLKIEPDFAKGRVLVTVPSADFNSGGLVITGTKIQYNITLKKGLVPFTTVYASNKPCLYLAILSIDQRQPVFVFGYGIWDESHPGLPNFPIK